MCISEKTYSQHPYSRGIPISAVFRLRPLSVVYLLDLVTQFLLQSENSIFSHNEQYFGKSDCYP
jgi:hypothetical protein